MVGRFRVVLLVFVGGLFVSGCGVDCFIIICLFGGDFGYCCVCSLKIVLL